MERTRCSILILLILSAQALLLSFYGCEGESKISNNSVPSSSATLAWEAPTTYADAENSCYEDPGGFKIYIIPSSGYNDPAIYDRTIKISIGSPDLSCVDTGIDSGTGCGNIVECTYTVQNLIPGTWQITLTTYNSVYVESDFSNVVTVVVQ